ncbi:uncharacterized protein BDZ83DRAFT_409305 [Colletotrichum acutatum]|uniref:Uncharacterized protein n=1 Tax=Glomerella acutata TaxID=27357 RepID=A0AAD8XE30_GLOAC|nr:uncharacterized protein BDZ83DRAFT_409305 [Colletotrichum acutatum]KAK1722926.1 hypothetical protein BDZ83DRAFT_409305 [Colletotrichum acutatum]
MGHDTTSTVYAGELQGIVLALEMAQADKQNGNHRSKVFIHNHRPFKVSRILLLAQPRHSGGDRSHLNYASRYDRPDWLDFPFDESSHRMTSRRGKRRCGINSQIPVRSLRDPYFHRRHVPVCLGRTDQLCRCNMIVAYTSMSCFSVGSERLCLTAPIEHQYRH